MSGNEIEPYIAKGVKLVLSNDEDSLEQLRLMLEESIRSKYGAKKALAIANLANRPGQQPLKRRPSISESDGDDDDDDDEEEDLKTSVKRMKCSDSNKTSGTSSPALTFENESSNIDSEDLNMEILEDNLCIVCRNVESNPRNSIVECMDCHSLYHQNCATPPIDADVNDPRFVWYCKNCSKGSNKGSSSACSSRASSCGSNSNNGSNSNHNSNSSSSSGNSGKAASSNSSRSSSQPPSYAMGSKPFGSKFKLFKSVKR